MTASRLWLICMKTRGGEGKGRESGRRWGGKDDEVEICSTVVLCIRARTRGRRMHSRTNLGTVHTLIRTKHMALGSR